MRIEINDKWYELVRSAGLYGGDLCIKADQLEDLPENVLAYLHSKNMYHNRTESGTFKFVLDDELIKFLTTKMYGAPAYRMPKVAYKVSVTRTDEWDRNATTYTYILPTWESAEEYIKNSGSVFDASHIQIEILRKYHEIADALETYHHGFVIRDGEYVAK